MVTSLAKWLLMILLVGPTIGCTTIYPVTSGFHKHMDAQEREAKANVKLRFVVWGDHPGVRNAIVGWLQEGGHVVVERARLNDIFNEQKIRLTHTPDDDAYVLRVGKLVGADRAIFSEVTVREESRAEFAMDRYSARGGLRTFYQLSVAVRCVNIESGEVMWSGTAQYPRPVNNPDQGAIYLAQSAIARAICPIEVGYEWSETTPWSNGGCIKR